MSVTPALSLFAFAELLARARRAGAMPLASARPTVRSWRFLGSEADRAARNRLQARWLARAPGGMACRAKAEVRRASGAVPQGAFVLRDGDARPLQVLLGSFAFSTDGLGLDARQPARA